jgi:activator of HSP90 ATPase
MSDVIKQEVVLDCSPDVAFAAWLDSDEHGNMVGSPGEAKIENEEGGDFDIWDGSIVGTTVEIDKTKHRIVQNWRYDYEDWSEDEPSKITLDFVADGDKTKLKFEQTDVPDHYVDEVAEGWKAYYWEPMKQYFAGKK